ncbi:MAG: HAD-IA family hydrolase [Bacteroidaceae bacterium]
MFENQIKTYLESQGVKKLSLKGVLFDMDGVLFDSMPYHAQSWHKAMASNGFALSEEEAYLHEGRTGAGTIDIVVQRELGRAATEEECKAIYADKSMFFNAFPQAKAMPFAKELIEEVREKGLTAQIVTGSGQLSLLDRIEENYPALFDSTRMVSAKDVVHGKPHPEPYLKGLAKSGYQPYEAIVVENAPLGVQAAHEAGIFTIAVNTGPMPDSVLWNAGADLLFSSMQDFLQKWEILYAKLNEIEI